MATDSFFRINRIFQTFGLFTSGIGVHYAESPIVNVAHQSCAKGLIIGQRVPPQIVIRVADGRTFELQDLLPSDSRFKVLIFAGDTSKPSQLGKVNLLAEKMGKPGSFLKRFAPNSIDEAAFDILSISTAGKNVMDYTDIPPLFRCHWSKLVFPNFQAI